jgi:cytochrome b561
VSLYLAFLSNRVSTVTAFSTRLRFSAMAQFFHWATAILVVAAFVYGPGGSELRVYSVAKDFDRQIHETLGISVLATTLIRMAWRAFDAAPEHPPMPQWMSLAARVVHAMIYILLLAVPLTAIFGAWLEGHPVTLLGNVRIGPLITEAHSVGSAIAAIHTWLGDAILWVAGVHAAAALYHHFVLRDGVLRSMLPGCSKPARRSS